MAKSVSDVIMFEKVGKSWYFKIVRKPISREEFCKLVPYLIFGTQIYAEYTGVSRIAKHGEIVYHLTHREKMTANTIAKKLLEAQWKSTTIEVNGHLLDVDYALTMQGKVFALYIKTMDSKSLDDYDELDFVAIGNNLKNFLTVYYEWVIATDGHAIAQLHFDAIVTFKLRFILAYRPDLYPYDPETWPKIVENTFLERYRPIY